VCPLQLKITQHYTKVKKKKKSHGYQDCLYPILIAVIPKVCWTCGNAVWETTARQLAECEYKMILANISIQVLASWHVWAKYDNLLLTVDVTK
jgi:hypothetical protein